MKAFWWFKENSVAGMARPGFNSCRWFDLPFDEAMLMGWVGQHSSGPLSLRDFQSHLQMYLPKAIGFYELDETRLHQVRDEYENPKGLQAILDRLSERSHFLSEAFVENGYLHFKINQKQLDKEIIFLKNQQIDRLVTLTESHHMADYLGDHFKLNHISILDMGAPTKEQVGQLAKILERSEQDSERVAVHCLAGIGRTSTTLMGAELLRGQTLDSLLTRIQKQNPVYAFVGAQAEFIRSLDREKNCVNTNRLYEKK